MNMYVRQHIERTRNKPLGKRQAEILRVVRARVAAGHPFPSLEEIAGALPSRLTIQDIQGSLLALEVRGMIRSSARAWRGRSSYATGWRLTASGWRVHLP
jgi:hypothetical protein